MALVLLAHLRCGDTYAHLAAGFGIGIGTVYRYIREAIEVLAALAPNLAEVMRTASRPAFVLLHGTLLPIDRIAADTLYCSGKHKRQGMNATGRSSAAASRYGRSIGGGGAAARSPGQR